MDKYTYIVPAEFINDLRQKLDGLKEFPGLTDTFTTPVFADGGDTPTHYIANGILSDEEAAFLDAVLPDKIKGEDVPIKGKPVADLKAMRVNADPLEFMQDYALSMVSADVALVDIAPIEITPIEKIIPEQSTMQTGDIV